MLERTDLIIPVGEWILLTACRQLAEWQKRGLSELRVSVNISPRQFRQDSLVDLIASALKKQWDRSAISRS